MGYVDPTLPDLCRAMGLMPIDDYIEQSAGLPGNRRQLGATTWMALSAAQALKDGKNAMVLCRTMDFAKEVAQKVRGFALRMSIGAREEGADWVKFHNGTTLRWRSGDRDTVKVIGFQGVLFNDALWAERAARRAEGPYAMIRSIQKDGDDYLGYAEDNEQVMEFTEAGAMAFLRANPEVRALGFEDPRTRIPPSMQSARVGKTQVT